jgi:NADH-quinone oxidoreductase subunit G
MMEPTPFPMVHVTIDDRTVEVPEGTLILDAAKEAGVDIPTFCYHHLMKPVAACRMCLVEVEKRPKLEPACAVTVTEGMVVHTHTPRVEEARHGVLEFLLLQHPLDCPVCDKGGECDLQDHTYNHGRFRSRYQDPKLHKEKRVPLSDLVVLDEERCIVCHRCVRFMEEVVEEPQLALRERGARTVVSVFPGRQFTSPFAGNTIEMCPVGALTSRPYRFQARPWDNTTAASVCVHCPVGCNLTVQARDGHMVRVLSRENLEVDGGWLCDRGRFGYRWVHHPRRYTVPVAHDRRGGETPLAWDVALARAREAIEAAGPRLGILGGGRLTAQAQVALAELARRAQTPFVDHRLGRVRYPVPPGPSARLADLDGADRILLAGTSPVDQVPVVDLRLKAALRRGARLAVVDARRVMPRHAAATYLCRPGHLGEALSTVARALEGESVRGPAQGVAQLLAEGQRVVVLWSGEEGGPGMEALAAALGSRLVGTLVTGGLPTSRGAERAGLRGPADTRAILEAAARGEIEVLLVADDLFEDNPYGDLAAKALERTPTVVALAQLPTETAVRADLVLPLASNFEQEGHYVNVEGRLQAVEPLLPPPGRAQADWYVVAQLAGAPVDAGELLAHYLALPEPTYRREEEAPPPAVAPGSLVALGVPLLFDSSVRWEEGLRARLPQPYVALHPDQLATLGWKPGDKVQLRAGNWTVEVELAADASLPASVVGVPRGVVGLPGRALHGQAVELLAQVPTAAVAKEA